MKIVDLTDGPLVEPLYHEVLRPAFPADELMTLDELRNGLPTGAVEGSIAVDDSRVVGAAIGEWWPSCRVMLLSYLAVVPAVRGSGIGTLPHTGQLDRWREKYRPCLVVAEVESPNGHHSSAAYGDPVARLRFYGRHGARVLDLPYFQPALSPQKSRVPDMLLLALHADPELTGPGGPGTAASAPIRTFLTEYLTLAEGGVGDDAATAALWRALDAPAGVRMLPVDRFREIPTS